MKCPKCNGKMIPERYYHIVRFHDSLKCLNCGTVTDPTIAANRARTEGLYKEELGIYDEEVIVFNGEIPMFLLKKEPTRTPKPSNDQLRQIGRLFGIKNNVTKRREL